MYWHLRLNGRWRGQCTIIKCVNLCPSEKAKNQEVFEINAAAAQRRWLAKDYGLAGSDHEGAIAQHLGTHHGAWISTRLANTSCAAEQDSQKAKRKIFDCQDANKKKSTRCSKRKIGRALGLEASKVNGIVFQFSRIRFAGFSFHRAVITS